MYSDFVKRNYTSQASMVEYGYGQVEPNHLSAQRTAQIYAQLPAAADIDVLEQGQFVKYNYAAANGGQVDLAGAGEWMLVYNEIKLYRDIQQDCEFAMVKDNYQARVYSPYDWEQPEADKQAIFLNGKDASGNTSITLGGSPATYKVATAYDATATYYSDQNGTAATVADETAFNAGTFYVLDQAAVAGNTYKFDDVTGPVDPYEIHYNEDPMHFLGNYKVRKMPEGTTMVPRVFKTNVGDIFTTNTVNANFDSLALGATLAPGAKGILEPAQSGDMLWQVVRKYTLADNQKAVKIMRIK
jgi:hypothetical protein